MIQKLIKEIEEQHNVLILHAVEGGDIEWSTPSLDTGYDIRFVYVRRNAKSYLTLRSYPDTIDGTNEDGCFSWLGVDITKALRLLSESNIYMIELFYAHNVYKSDSEVLHSYKHNFADSVRRLIERQNRMAPLMYHYLAISAAHYNKHLEMNEFEQTTFKSYFDIIRPIAMAEWLLFKHNILDIKNIQLQSKLIETDLKVVMKQLCTRLPAKLCGKVEDLIEEKQTKLEMDRATRYKIIDDWIVNTINHSNQYFSRLAENTTLSDTDNSDDYDNLLCNILKIRFDQFK